ncbi:hypothetical protein NFI96_008428, partial [Prochilodus magdalenae]
MELRSLRETITEKPDIDEGDEGALAEDEAKNGEAYAELVQVLDNKSLSLVMREAERDGRKALAILRKHYVGKDKPRVVSLYCELSSLCKASDETITEYIIRAETIFTSLRRADEQISDGLMIAMVVKGLPESYKPFVVHVTQTNEVVTFGEFKSKLRSYESTEKYGRGDVTEDNVMRTSGATKARGRGRGKKVDLADMECYACGKRGHMARACPNDVQQRRDDRAWDAPQRGKGRGRGRGRGRDQIRKADEQTDTQSSFFFKMSDCQVQGENKKGLMVDCGATSHMINDATKFKTVDKSFRPEDHMIELADGTKVSGMAKMRGEAEVYLLDSEGRRVRTRLKQALYIPSFPQNIFSVKAATGNGAEVRFKDGDDWLVNRDGKTPNLSNMKVFGSECYAYKQDKKKLDAKCDKGIFVGYDKYSPAYNIYYPETGKVLKHRLVKTITKGSADSQTQTSYDMEDDAESYGDTTPKVVSQGQEQSEETREPSVKTTEAGPTQADGTEKEQVEQRYPVRERKAPEYLKEYQCKADCDDEIENVDYFYRVTYGVPKTFSEAMNSEKFKLWGDAMKEEMQSLTENETFTLTPLPRGKQAVGGRWVYAVKESPNGSETCKARYVAKGYGQVEGIDYKETFSPTANMTSVRALMQVAVQEDLILHQMDVKTAYLHAPMDCECTDTFYLKARELFGSDYAPPKPTLTVEPNWSPLFTGESVTLTCVINPHSGRTYQWYKLNYENRWTAVSRSEHHTVNGGTLTIRGDPVFNGAQYRCRGEIPSRPKSSQYSDSFTLTVEAPPKPTLTVEPNWSPLFTGESVTLKCVINTHSGWTYQWYKWSKQRAWNIVSRSEHHTVNGGTLTIRGDPVISGDQYRCRGEIPNRPKSSQNSDSFTLTVEAERPKPELTSSHKGAAALIGNPVVLNCKVQSAGWKFYWSKHTQNPENETETGTPSYTISSVSVSDRGEYRCRAGRGDPVYYTNHSDALWIAVT